MNCYEEGARDVTLNPPPKKKIILCHQGHLQSYRELALMSEQALTIEKGEMEGVGTGRAMLHRSLGVRSSWHLMIPSSPGQRPVRAEDGVVLLSKSESQLQVHTGYVDWKRVGCRTQS